MDKIIHFSQFGPMICDPKLRRRGGKLVSNKWAHEGEFLYTTSDNIVTCKVCIQVRIDFHLKVAGLLEQRLG